MAHRPSLRPRPPARHRIPALPLRRRVSHARAFGLQLALATVPLIIAEAGLSAALGAESFAEVVARTVVAISPGSSDALVADVVEDGSEHGSDQGQLVVVLGLATAFVAATSAFAQLERGANRIYGTDRDRPALRKYARGALLTLTAGSALALGLLLIVAGEPFGDAVEHCATGGGARGWVGPAADRHRQRQRRNPGPPRRAAGIARPLAHQHPGVDGQRHTGDVPGLVGGQERHGGGDGLHLDQPDVEGVRDVGEGLGLGAGSPSSPEPPPNNASTAGLRTMRVATPDGFTQFTRIPCGASQVAKVRISPTTPCLLAT